MELPLPFPLDSPAMSVFISAASLPSLPCVTPRCLAGAVFACLSGRTDSGGYRCSPPDLSLGALMDLTCDE